MSEAHRIDQPRVGFYKRRAHRAGPWQPALIYEVPARDPVTFASMDRAPTLACLVDGQARDVETEWTWLFPISETEYRKLCAEREGVDDSVDLLNHPVRI